MSDFNEQTSATLLLKIRDWSDRNAWDRFVVRYEPMMQRWCRESRLQEADVAEVSQDVLLKLAKRIRQFTYDDQQSFRAWLNVVVKNCIVDVCRERKDALLGDADELVAALTQSSSQSREELESQLENDHGLLLRAMALVQQRMQPVAWDAFKRRAIDEVPGPEVARELGISVAAVYQHTSRVKKLLKSELESMLSSKA